MARILSIEDDADMQHLIGQVLFREGYDLVYAWNGQEGYEKILATDPDLILLDLMLPIMNGVELLKKLQDGKGIRRIPVIILSAYGDEANMLGHSVRALGAAEYLRKPLSVQELTRVIRQTLQQHPRTPAPPTREVRKGAVHADPKFLTVWVNDRLVATLSHKPFALLSALLAAHGAVSRPALLAALGYEAGQTEALKQAVHRLRAELGPAEAKRLRTTPEGYEFLG